MLFGVYGLYYAATEGVQKAFIADMVEPHRRATAIGTFNMYTGLVPLPTSVLTSWLCQVFGSTTAFSVSAALVGAAALLMFLV